MVKGITLGSNIIIVDAALQTVTGLHTRSAKRDWRWSSHTHAIVKTEGSANLSLMPIFNLDSGFPV